MPLSGRRRLSSGGPSMRSSCWTRGRGRTLRTAVVRPGIVYGGGRGIIAELLKNAANGLVRVIGDGRNHWACVYDRDLADLYLRVATSPGASGVYHANDEADERVVDIVEAVARQAKMKPDVRHVPIKEARAKMGPYADALALNQIVRGPRCARAGMGADAAFSRRKRGAAARGVPRQTRSRLKQRLTSRKKLKLSVRSGENPVYFSPETLCASRARRIRLSQLVAAEEFRVRRTVRRSQRWETA